MGPEDIFPILIGIAIGAITPNRLRYKLAAASALGSAGLFALAVWSESKPPLNVPGWVLYGRETPIATGDFGDRR